METKILPKLAVIAAISVALLVGLLMIGAQIGGRSSRQSAVLREIAESAAGSQTLLGPVCVLRYHELLEHIEKDKALDRETTRQEIVEGTLILPPQALDVGGDTRVETRSRGLYHARLFHSDLKIAGNFVVPAGLGLDPRRRILDSQVYLVMAVSDPRGITNDPVVVVNGSERRFSNGTVGVNGRPGAHIALGAVDIAQGGHFDFLFRLNLMGTERLSIAPVGVQTSVALKSDWPSPTFQGRFLPTSRTVSSSGFEAHWHVSSLARSFDETLKANPTGDDSEVLGVGFLEPVNVYSMSQRAVTYGILFIVLTFTAFFLTEILRRLRIHPLQYLLVGSALAIFFLLLIALSEHVPFLIAYGVSAVACVALIGIYLSGVLGRRKLGMRFAAGIALLYSILYGVLLSEDNALLMGTALLFAALGFTMLATRKIDWYQAVLSPASDQIQ